MASVDLSAINVIAELERIGWLFRYAGEDEVKCRCPAHDDDVSSCSVNVEKRLWKCHAAGCGQTGDFVTFLCLALRCSSRRVVLDDLSTRYELEDVKTVDPTVIEKYHEAIWKTKILLKELRKRGISDDSIRRYKLGVHERRITIPIPNDKGQFINVRRYLPGAPGGDKMRNMRGRGKIRLFPVSQLAYDTVVVCGGELKAIVVAQHLNDHGIGAITATAGEGNWSLDFTRRLEGKRVYVCMDIDEPGRKGANRLCAQIRGKAKWIGDVLLPLDVDQYPAGDVNDYFGPEGASGKDFLKLLDETGAWITPTIDDAAADDMPAEHLSLLESTKAEFAGKRVKVRGVVTALDATPYLVPATVQCICDRDQDFCDVCPVFAIPPDPGKNFVELKISRESPAILAMVNAPKIAQADAIREGLHIPPCKTVVFKTLDHYNVEDIRITPQLEIAARTSEHVMLPAYSVSHGLEMNVSYEFEGRTYPHPKTQQATMLVSGQEQTVDTLSNYTPTDDELADLSVFQPSKWTLEALERKIDALYEDFEANVTRIYKRRNLHLIMDLAFHSALVFNFDSRLSKGWVEVLVVGDSSQGKTETSKQLMEHYSLGEKVECKNASVAGLLGGVQQLGSRWFVTWGIIPTHDRRLVVLEELKGASQEIISKLTDMRSSGIAEIPKIEKRRTHARTRLIALSNPRSDHPMSSYNYGVDAIRELIGGPEDIRRFDMALILDAQEINPEELNVLASHRPVVEHRHVGDLCRRCVLWAWTRSPEQIVFEADATARILESATELCSRYTDVIPLVDRGSMRLKIARLSVALAARTFSTNTSPQVIVVRLCHVEFIAKFIDETYGSRAFGYADYSEAYLTTRRLTDVDIVRRKLLATPYPKDFIDQMLHASAIELRDICDWCGWDRGAGLELLSFFVRKHALHRLERNYRKTAEFIELLKRLRQSKDLEIADRPSHVKEPEDEF